MPTSRSELAAAALAGRIYVAGGIAKWGTRAAFEAYDPTTDRWEELPPLPEAAHHLAAAATDDRIYVTGGYTNLLFSEITKRAWAYDPVARRWTGIADLPGPRAAHGMAAIEGRLYLVGGVGPASEEVWVYDPATDSWEAAPAPLPTQREHLAVTVLDDKLYAVGGRWGDAGNLAALEIYDPAAGRWTRGPDLPTPRSGLTASVLKGRIHVVGGEALSLTRTFGEHEAYDPSRKAWSTLADLPTPRHGLASAVVGGRWYVIGGGAKAGALTYEMAEFAKTAYGMDVRYLGVCCGAGPHHIRALAEVLRRRPSASRHSPDMARHSYYGTDAKITAKNREYAARL